MSKEIASFKCHFDNLSTVRYKEFFMQSIVINKIIDKTCLSTIQIKSILSFFFYHQTVTYMSK